MANLLDRKTRRQVVDNLDCCCSSVLVNCCQISCCMHDVPNVEFKGNEASENYPNWMGKLIEKNPEVKLRDMVIPGTHDSGSYALHWMSLFSAVGRCQSTTISEQLYLGARYLDIRVAGASGGGDDKVSIWHGALECGPFNDVVPQIVDFLDNHPKEFIFLDIVQEYGKQFSPQQKLYTLNLLKDSLGDKVFKASRADLMDKKPLSEIVNSLKKNVCLMLHPRFFKEFVIDDTTYSSKYIEDSYGFVSSGKFLRSHWHNTRDLSNLMQWNLEEVQKYGGKNNGLVLNNQFVLTPGVGGAADVLSLLIGKLSLRPSSFAAKLYKKDILDAFFKENADEPWNLVMFDYIDLTPALVSFLINLNFPAELTILTAVAQDGNTGAKTEVTEKIRSHIKRGTVLYLHDIQNDLSFCREGTLVIAYRHGNADSCYSVLSIDFDAETELVLGQFCRNEEAVVVDLDMASTGPTGYISNGQIIGGEQNPGLNDTITLKYTFAEDETNTCVFEMVN